MCWTELSRIPFLLAAAIGHSGRSKRLIGVRVRQSFVPVAVQLDSWTRTSNAIGYAGTFLID